MSATVVINGQNSAATPATPSGNEDDKQNISESSSFSSEAGLLKNPRKGRSRREQAALAAKSCRGRGKSGYTAVNLRRYAAEKKTDKNLSDPTKRSVSLTTIKNSTANSTGTRPTLLSNKGTS